MLTPERITAMMQLISKIPKIDGVSYDTATGTFTLDMALTVNGDAIDENQNTSGNTNYLRSEKQVRIIRSVYRHTII